MFALMQVAKFLEGQLPFDLGPVSDISVSVVSSIRV
jgi:hypothetical protein